MAMSVSPVGEPVPANAEEPKWHISTESANGGGGCVEAGPTAGGELVVLRHSKVPQGAAIAFTDEAWREFLEGVRAGEFDF